MTSNKRIATLVMAAGLSSRFGSQKLLHKMADGSTLIDAIAAAVAKRDPNDVWFVTGHHAENMSSYLKGFQCLPVSDYAAGMGHSIAAGVRHLQSLAIDYEAVLIVLADQIALSSAGLEHFIETYEASNNWEAVQLAVYESGGLLVKTPPAIFPRRDFAALSQLGGDSGGTAIVKDAERHHRLQTHWLAEARIDIDTPADLEALSV